MINLYETPEGRLILWNDGNEEGWDFTDIACPGCWVGDAYAVWGYYWANQETIPDCVPKVTSVPLGSRFYDSWRPGQKHVYASKEPLSENAQIYVGCKEGPLFRADTKST